MLASRFGGRPTLGVSVSGRRIAGNGTLAVRAVHILDPVAYSIPVDRVGPPIRLANGDHRVLSISGSDT